MTETSIAINFDPDRLNSYTDRYLSMLWHLCQHNPADGFRDREPGELAMKVGWEIIRRWLRTVEPEMYHHQQSHYTWWHLGKFARRTDDGLAPRMIPDTVQMRDALAAKLADLGAWAANLSREQIAQELATIVLPVASEAGDQPDTSERDHAGQVVQRDGHEPARLEPVVTETQRWLIDEARDLHSRWAKRHNPPVIDNAQALADMLGSLLSVIDQIAPRTADHG